MVEQRSYLDRLRTRTAWVFLAPTLTLLILVAGWPLARTIFFGLTDAYLGDLAQFQFVGLDNYLVRYGGRWYGLLADPQWWRATWNTLVFCVVSVALETALGVITALVLNARFPGRGWVRAAVLVPWAIPTIVSAKMWGWMLNDQFGVVNHALLAIGLIDQPLAWTADPALVLPTVILVDVWKSTPFIALLTLAALQIVPESCYEAAKLDGAGPVRTFFSVTLPIVRPAILVAIVFRALDALRVFDVIYVLTSNNVNTMSMSIFARQQLVDFQDVGYGSAAATLLFFTAALLTALLLVAGRVRLTEGGMLR